MFRLGFGRALANREVSGYCAAMTTIAHCSNDAEAMLLKSLLEANGIEVFAPESLTQLAGLHVGGSGLRLQVDDADAETARKILAEAEASEADGDDSDLPA